ncbi:DNA-binding response regulator, OmpR family, contains REC and winged-helix (wHTH) domain [Acetitomaculum ruminis DSM 5522]|uniref:Stage 0 sporulation protein A homolog n=1 Tax=Acetitomaculum ruminis DSM 5522 TaxID=1120918 RepID=A0A1I0YAJ3_9FIRM|nr:response regulator transcription factor [Acetitomaculum ruminis]SFB10291.1 DNA-binding response regulator, OmpR family, contains REC and winged-helix (wHTH) domain [Acetitomaculum ruminis DSM 5522]
MRILLAEDTRDLSKVIVTVLEHQEYEVDAAYDGEEAIEYIKKSNYDAIILDIMMPKKNGIEVVKECRKLGVMTPVLFLTAKAETNDKVVGLDAGGDDYLTKPFSMEELMARIRSMTRRKNVYSQKVLKLGNLSLDAENFELSAENSVRLSNKEFELIYVFLVSANEQLEENFLLNRVWSEDERAEGELLWMYISYLKKKLESIAANVKIEGEKGGPYRLICQ